MKIEDVIGNHSILQKNYNDLLNKIGHSNDEVIMTSLLEMPTTHTFGYERTVVIDNVKNIVASIYPAKSIFFEDRAILSSKSQAQKKIKPIFFRDMKKARAYGLDDYVFSCLGCHNYFYAKTEGMSTSAFGIFLSPHLDNAQYNTNATLYDLASTLAIPYKPEDITLAPHDARSLTASEITYKYEKDFFNYWICTDYVTKGFYEDSMWEHKREFHYHLKVDVKDIKAIIWPIEVYYDEENKQLEIETYCLRDILEFSKIYEDVAIYKYVWNGGQPVKRFSYASYLISKSLFETNQLPEQAKFNDSFFAKFPNPKI